MVSGQAPLPTLVAPVAKCAVLRTVEFWRDNERQWQALC